MDAVDSIEGAGFTVYEASNADEAIRILETHHGIRVVFTDINMPGSMDGLKLAHYVRGRWPPIKLIKTSGHPLPAGEDFPEGRLISPSPISWKTHAASGKLPPNPPQSDCQRIG